ncbi:MAG: hypothetical protein WD431_02630 [Cyclobacteriaceae bacterium]
MKANEIQLEKLTPGPLDILMFLVLAFSGILFPYCIQVNTGIWLAGLDFSLLMALSTVFLAKMVMDKSLAGELTYRLFLERTLSVRLLLLLCYYIVSIFILHGKNEVKIGFGYKRPLSKMDPKIFLKKTTMPSPLERHGHQYSSSLKKKSSLVG